MIPSIEEILAGLQSGQYTLAQATLWIYKHQEIAGATADIVVVRDEFAGRAMQGLLAEPFTPGSSATASVINEAACPNASSAADHYARASYKLADAMLKARTA